MLVRYPSVQQHAQRVRLYFRTDKCLYFLLFAFLAGSYRKRHLWSTYEKGMFTAGEDDPPCFCLSRVPSVKLGFGICYDLEVIFPGKKTRFVFLMFDVVSN